MKAVVPTWNLSGMTCAFEEPAQVKTQWAFEAHKLIREFHVHLADLKEQSQRPALMKITRKRVDGLIPKVAGQVKCLEKLLEPLGWRSVPQEAFANYLTQSPGPSRIAANYDNLFRDWVWGENENHAAVERIAAVLPAGFTWGRTLVLGAGACRLAYDLHVRMKPSHTTVCDFNPLLMLAAEQIVRGKAVELVEFPLMPKDGAHAMIKQNLKAPAPLANEAFDFCLADATQRTFADASFDTVVTPWLIDVVEAPLADVLALVNQALPLGGSWICFGPLGFNDPVLAAHYSLEEVKYLVEKSGFRITGESYEMIPYMHNPSSNSHREERVLTLRAEKTKTVELYENADEHEEAAWQSDKDARIEIPVAEMGLVQGHRLNGEVLSLVQDGASFNEIAGKISTQHGLPREHAEYLITHILGNAEDLAHRNPLRQG